MKDPFAEALRGRQRILKVRPSTKKFRKFLDRWGFKPYISHLVSPLGLFQPNDIVGLHG